MLHRHDLAIELAIEIIFVVLRHDAENLALVIDAIKRHHALWTNLEAAPATDACHGVDRGEIGRRPVGAVAGLMRHYASSRALSR